MSPAVDAVRSSHQRFASLVAGLGDDEVRRPSYDDDWSIADVASHLGSQAEVFGLFLDAGLSGEAAPGVDAFHPIWDRWNAKAPAEQVADSVAANEAFVTRLETVSDAERSRFRVSLFGPDESGVGGGAGTIAYAFAAFVCGLVASELMLLLLRTTPTPLTYYGWIVGLVTTVAAVVPLTMGSDFGARVAIALTNACIGTAIGALTVSATRRSITYTPPSEPDLQPPYI